jgi:hypothetical protein
MDDPLIVALQQASPRALLLLAERMERLAGLRHRLDMAHRGLEDQPTLARASQAVMEALEVHIAVLHATLKEVQSGTFSDASAHRIQVTWERLVTLQASLGSPPG